MNKKQLKEWLLYQIKLAIANTTGDYVINDKGEYVFILPEVGTKFTINCLLDPNDYKNSRLHEFYNLVNKSPAFKNTKLSPKI
jgi:hypothetical protein